MTMPRYLPKPFTRCASLSLKLANVLKSATSKSAYESDKVAAIGALNIRS